MIGGFVVDLVEMGARAGFLRAMRALTHNHVCTMIEAASDILTFPDFVKTFPRPKPRRRYQEYQIWNGMMQRCYNQNRDNYKFYGAIGVRVCERWHNLVMFIEDMAPRPSLDHTLDRWPDKAGNYSPTNCRWATKIEQANNCKDNVLFECDEKSLTASQWGKISGIDGYIIRQRVEKYGWPAREAIFLPIGATIRPECRWSTKKSRIVEFNGERRCLAEWCSILSLCYHKVHQRIHRRGWSIERAFGIP